MQGISNVAALHPSLKKEDSEEGGEGVSANINIIYLDNNYLCLISAILDDYYFYLYATTLIFFF